MSFCVQPSHREEWHASSPEAAAVFRAWVEADLRREARAQARARSMGPGGLAVAGGLVLAVLVGLALALAELLSPGMLGRWWRA